MPRLSVNINKIATLRNARGGNIPDLISMALDCENFGAEGITVHPRPDERHIRYKDVRKLRPMLKTEFNMEGFPSESFLNLVMEVKPEQVTLVPDGPDVVTSNAGWDTVTHHSMLKDIILELKKKGMRTSLFIECSFELIEAAAKTGTDRIELYTGDYAENYTSNRDAAVAPYVKAAEFAASCGLGINAGHDLNLANLRFFAHSIPQLEEVSIGHAIVSDALYFGIDNTIKMYLRELRNK